jgi:tRNA (guanosine-2'-O-)-methyltransferase
MTRTMTRNLNPTELKRLHRDWRRRTDRKLALLIEDVQQPFNLGAISRSAAAYRVDHLWLVGAAGEEFGNAKVNKTALGSQRYLTWTKCDDVQDAITRVRKDGYDLVGVELADGGTPLFEVELGAAVCLAIGHEDRGLSTRCLEACDRVAFLPLAGRIGSLNVATATSIALYEARRQEWVAQ